MSASVGWDDLDPTEQKCLRQVRNRNIRRHGSTRQQRTARRRLEALGLLQFDDRHWYMTGAGDRVLDEWRLRRAGKT